jgi:hypothetical protein
VVVTATFVCRGSRDLFQRVSSLRVRVSHWIKPQQAVVSAALTYRECASTSEISVVRRIFVITSEPDEIAHFREPRSARDYTA